MSRIGTEVLNRTTNKPGSQSRPRHRRRPGIKAPELLERRVLLSTSHAGEWTHSAELLERPRQTSHSAEVSTPINAHLHAIKQNQSVATPSSAISQVMSAIESTSTGTTPGTWTVMFYANGDNLNQQIYNNILELQQVQTQSPASVKIVILYSQPTNVTAYKKSVKPSGGGSQIWTYPDTTGEGLLTPIPAGDPNNVIYANLSLSQSNVGDAATLQNFIVQTEASYPAQNYALIFSDHGGGVNGFNFDQNYARMGVANAELTSNKLVQALTGARSENATVNLLAFDECLMASTEVEYEVRDLVPDIVASEELVPGGGFNFVTALNPLITDPATVTAQQLASSMVTSYANQYVNQPGMQDTLSAVQTSALASLATDLKAFDVATTTADSADWANLRRARSYATKFSGTNPAYPFRDLGQFLSSVSEFDGNSVIGNAAAAALSALNQAVFATTPSKRQVQGLSIVLPQGGEQLPKGYASAVTSFLKASGWLSFLQRFSKVGSGGYCDDPVDWAEYNNTANTATNLGVVYGPGVRVPELTLPHGDIDWYSFTTAQTGVSGNKVTLLDGLAPTDSVLQVFAADNPSTPLRTGSNQISLAGLAAGNYLVEVAHAGVNLSFRYSLAFNAPSLARPTSLPSFNDEIGYARDLGTVLDPTLITTDINANTYAVFNRTNASQSAWYEFETPQSTTPMKGSFEILGGSAQNLTVTLYNQQGQAIRTLTGARDIKMPFSADGSGESYYISISGGVGTYELFFKGLG